MVRPAESFKREEIAMAVGVVLEFEGATLDQYDQVIEKMGLAPGGATPPGALFHWVTQTDNGFRVTDVWRDRETFERFAEEQIGPYSAEVGITNPPQTSFFDVHHYVAGNDVPARLRPPGSPGANEICVSQSSECLSSSRSTSCTPRFAHGAGVCARSWLAGARLSAWREVGVDELYGPGPFTYGGGTTLG
jgi:hypothetical protein